MTFDFASVLKGIAEAAPVLAQAPALIALFGEVIESFDGKDQDELKEALADARADNDAGHARLQEKLARAAQQ